MTLLDTHDAAAAIALSHRPLAHSSTHPPPPAHQQGVDVERGGGDPLAAGAVHRGSQQQPGAALRLEDDARVVGGLRCGGAAGGGEGRCGAVCSVMRGRRDIAHMA